MYKLFTIACLFLFLQVPFFMTQYEQRLEGHINELRHWKRVSRPEAAASHLKASSDPIVKNQGEVMTQLMDRLSSFTKAKAALSSASAWTRPFVFASHFDSSLAWETVRGFQIGFAVNLEALAYLCVGLLVSLVLKPRSVHAPR